MGEDSQLEKGLMLTKAFMINTVILFVSYSLYTFDLGLIPSGISDIPLLIFIISFIVEVVLLIVLTRLSKTESICEIEGCDNTTLINKKVCPKHDEEVVNALRNNRIAAVVGLTIVVLYFLILK
ncbi:MAG: hypothetical protein HOL29_02340 [Euryarchaeota archaeon]|jgi:hypothetical protein|nr:hypothetical protein [Euryarchaeota archaeon]